MNKFFLHYSDHKEHGKQIWVENYGKAPALKFNTRVSPIFFAYSAHNINPKRPLTKDCELLLLYTTDTFYVAANILKNFSQNEVVRNVYLTHGFSSIIIFAEDKKIANELLTSVKDYIVAYESWPIIGGKVESGAKTADIPPPPEVSDSIIKYEGLRLEDNTIFKEVAYSIQSLKILSTWLAPGYKTMLDGIEKFSALLSRQNAFLNKNIDVESFKISVIEILGHDQEEEAERLVSFCEKCFLDDEELIIRIAQIKDDAIQISGTLQIVACQAFSGMPPISKSSHQSGLYSLFGIGLPCFALLGLYNCIQNTFGILDCADELQDKFSTYPGFALPDKKKKASWRINLRKLPGLRKVVLRSAEDDRTPIVAHQLLYFSNRLGFRATKLSVSAAYQSIPLGVLPEQNLATLTHEYMHTHVKSILSILTPIEDVSFDEAYEAYRNPQTPSSNMLISLRALLIQTSANMCGRGMDRKGKLTDQYFSKREVKKALIESNHLIDELLVHVTDFTYFYDQDPELYVNSIWSSWLTLPFITTRLEEYALRTISAISIISHDSWKERFTFSYNKLIEQLEDLSNDELISDEPLNTVINKLKEEDIQVNLLTGFYNVISMVDSAAELLICDDIIFSFNEDDESALQRDMTYGLDIQLGEFPLTRLKNPIAFLMHSLKKINQPEVNHIDNIHFYTLWHFCALSSSMYSETVPER